MATQAHSGLSVKNLYALETVHVVVGPNKRKFSVPRGLICAKSDYFNKAFQRHFQEGKQGVITLVHVKEWVFECFVGWLYTDRIFWEPLDESLDAQGPTPQTKPDDCEEQDFDEDDRQNPVTWSCSYLIELFIFADQHDTRLFRNAVMEIFAVKMLQRTPKVYHVFNLQEARTIFLGLPDSSTLYRFALDMLVFCNAPNPMDPETISQYAKLPAPALATITVKALQLSQRMGCDKCEKGKTCDKSLHPDVTRCLPDFYFDICSCHEHETEKEKEICRKNWEVLNEKHDMDLEFPE